MARYLLNSAVITAEGTYRYQLISREQARDWYTAHGAVSTIGYQQTADALSKVLGAPVAVDRRTVMMLPEDQALVFRLVFPPGAPRIDPRDKGAQPVAVLANHFELGLLERLT
jgi:Domain of unknown function (DUF1874)